MTDKIPVRWIVLGLNGAFVTLARAAPPDKDALVQAAKALDQQGLVGWYVLMRGDFYKPRSSVTLVMLRLLSAKDGLFDMATDAFRKRRKELFKRLKQAETTVPKDVTKPGEFP